MLRFSLTFLLFLLAAAGLSAAEDAAVVRARADVNRITALVGAGVLPRARQLQAEDALADAQDDSAIREALYQKDITPEQADATVALTEKRVARRQRVLDERNKWLEAGIIARSETADSQAALDQAKSQYSWAVTRSKLARELADLARSEQEIMRQMQLSATQTNPFVEHFTGSNHFAMTQFPAIEKAFETHFAHPLPVSAMGETEVHKSLEFDHRNRVDIALQPDLPEGQWLRRYLTAHDIPFYAFRSAIAHRATGAHIHIGPPSDRLLAQVTVKPQRTASSR